jgi:hypothetical protein
MVSYEVIEENLHLRMKGMDKLWALKSELSIALSHINAVRLDSEIVHKWWHGLRLPGSNIPGLLTAGTFYQDGKRVFWDIHHPQEAVVISLDHEQYNELVIEVENPEAFVADMQAQINR